MPQFNPEQRMNIMRERLTVLSPTMLNIIDDSHHHIGHAGAKDGASHFTLEISSPKFVGLSLIAKHRLIYDVLGDLIPHEIHALKIHIRS